MVLLTLIEKYKKEKIYLGEKMIVEHGEFQVGSLAGF